MKKINIQVANKTFDEQLSDLKFLKQNKYTLCVAKMVNEEYTIVWKALKNFSINNNISWTPKYQIFASDSFRPGYTVDISTNSVDIQLGQKATLNELWEMETAKSGGKAKALNVNNKCGDAYIGVNLVTGSDDEQIGFPIYLSPLKNTIGEVELLPKEIYKIWFQQNIITSTMISEAHSSAIEVDLTNKDNYSILYENRKWLVV